MWNSIVLSLPAGSHVLLKWSSSNGYQCAIYETMFVLLNFDKEVFIFLSKEFLRNSFSVNYLRNIIEHLTQGTLQNLNFEIFYQFQKFEFLSFFFFCVLRLVLIHQITLKINFSKFRQSEEFFQFMPKYTIFYL